jgi:TRAP-type C4-dicarboxylate transport system permease small subunit
MAHGPVTVEVRDRPRGALERAIGGLSLVCGWLAAGMIVVSVAITCQMIFVRFVLNLSTVWQTEAVTFLMIGATLVGLPYVQRQRGHVNVDLLPGLLPPPLRKGLALLVLAASIAVMGVMFWYGYELFELAARRGWRTESVWGPPLWIPYLAMPLGFGLFILQLVADLVGELRGGA